MSRKTIFELVSEKFDLSRELYRIRVLFEEIKVFSMPFQRDQTVLDYVKLTGFSQWKNRGHCIDADVFLDLLCYKDLWGTAVTCERDFLTLLEIIYNFWYIASVFKTYDSNDRVRDFFLLKEILDDCLSQYNYKGIYFQDREQLIVIENKPEVTAVAEIVNNNVAYDILRYNHYTLKGDLKLKKGIILAIGSDLEPKRKKINAVDNKLEEGIFYMLNNLHLRHNNKTIGNGYYNEVVDKMDDETLEYWYDELYQMMLLAYLELDQIERNDRINELRSISKSK